jgi:hypothetical protein
VHRFAQALLVLTAVGLVAVLVSLGAVLVPRMRPRAALDVFTATHATPGTVNLTVEELAAHAWEQGAVLARIATAKFAAVCWALLGTGVAAVGFAGWSEVVACL